MTGPVLFGICLVKFAQELLNQGQVNLDKYVSMRYAKRALSENRIKVRMQSLSRMVQLLSISFGNTQL